jgi:hypothetical protein
MDIYLILGLAVAAGLLVLWWIGRRRALPADTQNAADRLDTLLGWPPEATRVLRTSERVAYSTLRLALPGYMVLAQVPIARFINVPKRNSYAEWMRRVGSQCVDFVVCDVTSQVVAVVEVRPAEAQMSERLRRRLDRVSRTLKAVHIPLHVWNEDVLPSVEAVRASLTPKAPAIPPGLAPQASASAAALADPRNPFADTDPDPSDALEVIELTPRELAEPSASTWFDELDSAPLPLTPHTPMPPR